MPEFVRDNAGKAFEFMVDSVNEQRKEAGLPSIEDVFAGESLVMGQNVPADEDLAGHVRTEVGP